MKNEFDTIQNIEMMNTNQLDLNNPHKQSDISTAANDELKIMDIKNETDIDKTKFNEDFKEEQEYIESNIRLPEESKSDVHPLDGIPVNQCNKYIYEISKFIYYSFKY